MFKNKFKASLIHLLLSAVVISALVSLMLLFWFPSPFLGVTNFKDIALILIAIDLVLGPLLTFVVFNPSKKSLKFDLSVIVAIQVMGLSYGLYMLYLTHPVYVTYYEKGFSVITAKHAIPEKAKLNHFKVSKLSSPTLAYMAYDEDTNNKLFNEMLDGEGEIEARVDYYQPYQNHLDKILANSLDAVEIFSEKDMSDASRKFLNKNNNNIEGFAFLPLANGASANGIIVLDKKTGEPVTMIKTSPWKYVKK